MASTSADSSSNDEAEKSNDHSDCGVGDDEANESLPLQPQDQKKASNGESKGIPSQEDRETFAAVKALLEASIRQLPSNRTGNAAKALLEQVKAQTSKSTPAPGSNDAAVPMEVDGDGEETNTSDGVEGMARKVSLSLVHDLSEILEAIADVRPSGDPTTGKISPPSSGVEASLLCDEEDLVQLREEGSLKNDGNDTDDEIVEISQDENFVQQNLICHETEEGLFGDSAGEGNPAAPDKDDDLLFAQKVALLRETKRLIRAKTLVLTKRRLAIRDDEDLSLVI